MALFTFVDLTRHVQSLESWSGNRTRPTYTLVVLFRLSDPLSSLYPILLCGILWTDVTDSEATGKPTAPVPVLTDQTPIRRNRTRRARRVLRCGGQPQ